MPTLDIHRRELKRIYEEISHQLRCFRDEREMSLEQVAAESGMSMQQLNRFEQGEALPSLPELYVLSQVLDTRGMLSLIEAI